MASLLDFLMRAQPAAEGDISDSLSTTASDPLLQAYLRLQASRVKDAVTAPRDAYTGDLQVFDPSTGHVSDTAMDRANGMAGLAMTGGLGGVARGGTTIGAGPIRAYHGSPHSFDKFNMSAIGSGEGAQAFGHGLYFAENEGVARSYRDALRPGSGMSDVDKAARWLDRYGGDADAARGGIREQMNRAYKSNDLDAVDGLRRINGQLYGDTSKLKGSMYEVGINADPAHFLDWDAPLPASHPARKIAEDLGAPLRSDATGADAYSTIRDRSPIPGSDRGGMLDLEYGSPAEASRRLSEAGVPGIRYLDGGSRADGAGSSNFVVFNDDLVSILRKYGLAGMAALGAGSGAVSNLGMGGSPQGASY